MRTVRLFAQEINGYVLEDLCQAFVISVLLLFRLITITLQDYVQNHRLDIWF